MTSKGSKIKIWIYLTAGLPGKTMNIITHPLPDCKVLPGKTINIIIQALIGCQVSNVTSLQLVLLNQAIRLSCSRIGFVTVKSKI
jgi:hypothetical protein